ncbi:MAG: trigger factor family protein, partial [Bacteroidales bacterium]|nr:trigger factor family protein [Bacteroidales bacterium]
MEITRNNIDALNATIKITVTKDDYQSKVDSSLKDIQKKAVFKGFRPGKAPLGLVKKEFNARTKADEINKIVSKELMNYLKENKVDYMGEPMPSEAHADIAYDYEKDENFDFYIDIALAPEFDTDIDSSLSLKQYVINIEDSAIDKAVEQYKNAAGKQQPAEVSGEKSFLKGEVYQIDSDNARIADGLSNRTSMLVDRVKDEEQRKKFIGRKAGDEITFDLSQI